MKKNKGETRSDEESAAELLDAPADEEETPGAPEEETPEERARRECKELTEQSAALSAAASAYVEGDIEFESLVGALQAATAEYDALSERLKRKRKTGELTRRSKRRQRRAGKEVNKRRDDLNVYLYYHDISLLLLESPQAYACAFCRNKQPVETEDGAEVCRLRLEQYETEE